MKNKNWQEIMEYEPCPAEKNYYERKVQPGSAYCMQCSNFLEREYVDTGREGIYRIKCTYGGKK